MDVTSFFSTPVIAAVVAGALGVSAGVLPLTLPETLSTAPAVVTIGVPEPFIGPDPVGGGSSLERVAQLDGVALLDQLGRLTRTELADFLERYPSALEELITSPPQASAVAAWWARTSYTSRTALSNDIAEVLGSLEGLPYAVRDSANRAFLTQTAAGIQTQLDAGVGRAMEDELVGRLGMLAAVEKALQPGASGEPRSLISLDVLGEGRAVIGIGALSQADYVTFFVPGMYVGVSAQLVDWAGNAETSLLEQQAWLERLGRSGEVATIAWIGYQTPTLVNIAGLDLAYEGRDALTRSLQGLDAASTGDPFVSIVAHSYGSTAAMLALEENDVSVDALIMLASPGSPATTVEDLKVTNGNVWVAASDNDPIPRSGVFGSQPLDAKFGAHRFSVHAMTDPISGLQLTEIGGHVYYFWPGTAAVRNTALIAIDQGALVSTDDVALPRASAAR